MNSQVFTDALGLHPHTAYRSGGPRTTLTGELLEGLYQHSYWASSYLSPDDGELPAFLSRAVKSLQPHQAFFGHIRETGGKIEFFIGLFADSVNIGATFPHELLADLGNLGVDLSLDIYDYKDGEHPSA